MKQIQVPVIYWKQSQNVFIGKAIGLDLETTAENAQSLLKILKEEALRIYSSDENSARFESDNDPDGGILFKSRNVSFNPSYIENGEIYPVANTYYIRIYAIYYPTSYGSYKCILPQLDYQFHLSELKSLDTLINHFAIQIIKDFTPDELHRLIHTEIPGFEVLTLHLKKRKKQVRVSGRDISGDIRGIAEKLPYTQQEKSRMHILPEEAWERDAIIKLLLGKILNEKVCSLLVGEKGVGKSAIILEAIKKADRESRKENEAEKDHSEDEIPYWMKSMFSESGFQIFGKSRSRLLTFWKTSPSRIISGSRYLGDWQKLCDKFIDDIENANGIVWLEHFMELFSIGGEGPQDSLGAYILPFIKKQKLILISELTPSELDRARYIYPGFTEHFQIIKVNEPERKDILKILNRFNLQLNVNNNVSITDEAMESALRLLNRHVKYEKFPGKALNFLGNCAARLLAEKQNVVDISIIYKIFSETTGLPLLFLSDKEKLDENELRMFFVERIKGQDGAIDAIASVIKVFKTGLNDPAKPIATMLFAGPTGVGKTASAKALASYMFSQGQKQDPMIRFDMSEYQNPEQIGRLIGDRYGTSGKLVSEVRQRPFSVILFDEIEKAHPALFDAILNLLDEGMIFDSLGRMTDFRNTIIIMSSNLGSGKKTSLGFKPDNKDLYERSIRAFFKPEFYNRIDFNVVFNSLNPEAIRQITVKELSEIDRRGGIKKRGIRLSFSDSLINFIAKEGFDEKYGARPLQRKIESVVIAPLARYILQHKTTKIKNIYVDLLVNDAVFNYD